MKRIRALLAVLLCATAAIITQRATETNAATGNSDAAHACQQGGYVHLVGGDGRTFANTGDCVSYAAHGGMLIPISTCTVTSTTGCMTFNETTLPWFACWDGRCLADPSTSFYQNTITVTGAITFDSVCSVPAGDKCAFELPNLLATGSGFYQIRDATGAVFSQGEFRVAGTPDTREGLFQSGFETAFLTPITTCSLGTYSRLVSVGATLIDSKTGQTTRADLAAVTHPSLGLAGGDVYAYSSRFYGDTALGVSIDC